jgi:hypothetical protein
MFSIYDLALEVKNIVTPLFKILMYHIRIVSQ